MTTHADGTSTTVIKNIKTGEMTTEQGTALVQVSFNLRLTYRLYMT